MPDGLLLLLGAGGHGRVAADLAECIGWESIAFLANDFPGRRTNGSWPILGPIDESMERISRGATGFVSIGDNTARLELHRRVTDKHRVPVLVHPAAIVSKYARIGAGTIVCAGAVVGAFAEIGDAVIVNTGASVDHDCRIGDGVHISPGANLSGGVVVGERTWIGAGAAVREGLVIGRNVVVGAGAAVVRSLEDGVTALGVPARA